MRTVFFGMRLVVALAFDMLGSSLAQTSAVLTLRNRSSLFIDMDERTILVVAGTDPMTPHASLAGKFFSVDEHPERYGRKQL